MHRFLTATAIAIALSGCSLLDSQTSSDSLPIVQTISGFNKPESSALSLDGKTLFVSNCGSGFFGEKRIFALAAGKGAISRLSIDSKGEFRMQNPRFVEGITAPLGMSVLPKATARIPAGSLFVNTGYFQQTDADNNYILDYARLAPAILIIDPQSGKITGRIDLGAASPAARAKGSPFLVPNGLAFDKDSHLYITETGAVDERVSPPVTAGSGVLKIRHDLLDRLLEDQPVNRLEFLSVPGGANGIAYDNASDALYIVTCGDKDPDNGAVFKVARDKFASELPPPLARNLTPIDGIAKTSKGKLIISLFSGELVEISDDGSVRKLQLKPNIILVQPSDLKTLTLESGTQLLIVPEQAPKDPMNFQQTIRIIKLE